VTGGAGFIGSNFVHRIADGTYPGFTSVTVLDKFTYAGNFANLIGISHNLFEIIEGDICDQDLMKHLSKHHDAIVNFAAETHVDRSIQSSADFVRSNVLGVQCILDAVRASNVKVVVQVSTDEVYGSIPIGSWDEEVKLQPNSPYAATKAAGDLLARSFFNTFDIDVRITRSSNNFGPRQFPEKIIPLFVTNILQGRKVPIYGSGRNYRDWLHVDDNCRGIYSVLMKGAAGEIYNIGGGTELSNLDLTTHILKIMGASESVMEFVPDRLGHDFRYSVDFRKISNELGYVPSNNFQEKLSETIQWYVENRIWWEPLKSK
jgi:dTDP-glucose 4,6-dehydratase